MKEDKKKVFIRTLGCQMNVRDSEVVCGLLKNSGYGIVDEPDKADVVIFNTCSVRQHAEDKVWSEIGRFKKGQSLSGRVPFIGLIRCMAKNYQDKVFERAPNVDFVVGPSDIDKIPAIINILIHQAAFKPRLLRRKKNTPLSVSTLGISQLKSQTSSADNESLLTIRNAMRNSKEFLKYLGCSIEGVCFEE